MHEIQHRLVKGEKDKDIMRTVLLSEKKTITNTKFSIVIKKLCYYI